MALERLSSFLFLTKHVPIAITDQYLFQFHEGCVEDRPARALGETLAQMHDEAHYLNKIDIYDEARLNAYLQGFFGKTVLGMESYAEHYGAGANHCGANRNVPEVFRSIGRALSNAKRPSSQTGVYAHFDCHLLNILVKESHSCNSIFSDELSENGQELGGFDFESRDDESEIEEDIDINEISFIGDTPTDQPVKLVDFEHANWGPAGTDRKSFHFDLAVAHFSH
jgi:hypothetical protein